MFFYLKKEKKFGILKLERFCMLRTIMMNKHNIYTLFFSLIGSLLYASAPIEETNNNNLSWAFEENKGQLNSEVLFSADLPGGKVFLEKNTFTYTFYNTTQWGEQMECNHDPNCTPSMVDAHAYKMHFIGSNPSPVMTTTGKKTAYHNYFIGKNKSKWAPRVRLFDEVTYHDLYTNIDLRVYRIGATFKYDFIVLPGGDPNDIALEYEGLDALTKHGDNLKISTSVTELEESIPLVYQPIGNEQTKLICQYSIENNMVYFDLQQSYNSSLPLIIDPVMVISTYCGTTSGMEGVGATDGEGGTIYACAADANTGYPTTPGAYQVSINEENDIAIGKYDSTGSNLIYATFIGGIRPGSSGDSIDREYPSAMRVSRIDSSLFVVGHVNTPDFPTTENVFDTSYNGSYDIVVFRLGKNGDTLLASTYIGGSRADGEDTSTSSGHPVYAERFKELIEAPSGGFYISGTTGSSDFPTNNPLQGYGGGIDGCLFHISYELDTLYWSTYIGGSNNDVTSHVNIGPDSLLYITGMTKSADFNHVPNYAYKTTLSANSADAYVLKITQDGQQVIHGTLLGTNSFEIAYFTDFDADSTLYVLGYSSGGNYPVSNCRYFMNQGTMFIEKLNDSLSHSFFSTRIGNNSSIPMAFMIDSCSRIYTASWNYISSFSAGLPYTDDAYDTIKSSVAASQFYVCVLSNNARGLDYATYLGGGHNEIFNGLNEHTDGGISRFNKKDRTLYLTGCTYSRDILTDPNDVYPTSIATGSELITFKMKVDPLVNRWEPSHTVSGPTVGCKPLDADFIGTPECGYNMTWYFGIDNDSAKGIMPSYTYDTSGSFLVTVIMADTLEGDICKLPPDTSYLNITVVDELIISASGDTGLCFPDTVALTASGTDSFAWSPSTFLDRTDSSVVMSFPDGDITYQIIGYAQGCTDTVEFSVSVYNVDGDVCCDTTILKGKTALLNISPPSTENIYSWTPSNGLSCTSCSSTDASPDSTTTYYVTITSPEGCIKQDTVIVEVYTEHLAFPSIFTPNSDGTNDLLGLIEQGYKDLNHLRIYNRWGQVVFEANDLDDTWDGTYNGELQENGVYTYAIEAVNQEDTVVELKGVVALVR